MPPRKRTASAAEDVAEAEPVAKRRSSRQAAAAATVAKKEVEQPKPSKTQHTKPKAAQEVKKGAEKAKKGTKEVKNEAKEVDQQPLPTPPPQKPAARAPAKDAKKKQTNSKNTKAKDEDTEKSDKKQRAASEDPDVDDIPTVNPEAPRHDGEWYWLMKAEPETRYENGIDVRFSIDDLRAKKKPEGWDGTQSHPCHVVELRH